ncbi:MAG: hypothetical protein LBC84_01855 [Prevotellaceae bacterium]|jgi:hypothetical protein|nr:hypothetical protein [Prevotellaceae bacterium]
MFKYLIRVVKYMVYCFVLLCLLLSLVFYTSDHGQLTYFWEMIPSTNYWQVALFLIAFAAVYPFIGYAQRTVYLNRSFETDREALIEPILFARFQITDDFGQKLVFRHKSAFTRLMRLYEDAITIDYSNNPVIITGLRRDVYRFARYMEHITRQLT